MTLIDKICLALVIAGSLNWAGVGIFAFDTVAFLLGGSESLLARSVYTIIGASGIWCITLFFKNCRESK